MDQSLEQWRPVVGYEGEYEVSDHGRVRSLPMAVRRGSGVWMKPGRMLRLSCPQGRHYPTVNLRRRTREVHRLVAEAFLGPAPDGMVVAHWDGDGTNNHVSNLRWDTHAGNFADMKRHGTVMKGAKNPQARLTTEQVQAIRHDPRPLLDVAAQYGVCIAHVSGIRLRKRWAHLP